MTANIRTELVLQMFQLTVNIVIRIFTGDTHITASIDILVIINFFTGLHFFYKNAKLNIQNPSFKTSIYRKT